MFKPSTPVSLSHILFALNTFAQLIQRSFCAVFLLVFAEMRYQLYTAWTSSVLLAQAISLPRHKTQHAEIGTRSVNLQFNANCPESRHGELTAAWDDALRLAANVGTINFNEAVAIDFLGPPAINGTFHTQSNKE